MSKNPLEMSDADIMNMTAPPSANADGGNAVEEEQSSKTEEEENNSEADAVDPNAVADADEPNKEDTDSSGSDDPSKSNDETKTDGEVDEQGNEGTEADDKEQQKPGNEAVEGKEEGKDPEDKSGDEDKGKKATEEGTEKATKADPNPKSDVENKDTPPNYEEMYNKVMAPFKANGKTIELKSPEEAVGLMQMGANYTKKMQELQPFRKILMMLQNNDLINEDKLNFLIDLDKKNPDAIHKLIKDSGIDPVNIDLESETTYLEGSHKVSNDEVKFASTVESVGSTDSGVETLNVMKTWDDTSKELLYSHPEVMTIIHQQREAGIFQAIDAEVDRQRALGRISPETPYLQAYKIAGDSLQEKGQLPNTGTVAKEEPTTDVPKKDPVVLDERVATPKPKVDNGEQANAASPTRSSPQKVSEKRNPLALSDEEFMKQFDGRL